jgi:hypothetical protein
LGTGPEEEATGATGALISTLPSTHFDVTISMALVLKPANLANPHSPFRMALSAGGQ